MRWMCFCRSDGEAALRLAGASEAHRLGQPRGDDHRGDGWTKPSQACAASTARRPRCCEVQGGRLGWCPDQRGTIRESVAEIATYNAAGAVPDLVE